jgi:hypothetical protein
MAVVHAVEALLRQQEDRIVLQVERAVEGEARELRALLREQGQPRTPGMDQLVKAHRKGQLSGTVLTAEQVGDMAMRVARLEKAARKRGKR